MNLFDPNPSLRWLFCLTHPDDELAIAAWIHRLASHGVEVHLCWTTANEERRWEAGQAARLLNVSEVRRHFLNGTDRRVEQQLARLQPEVNHLLDRVAPDRVVVGAFEQGHLDHDATNFLVSQAIRSDWNSRPILFLEAPFYHAYCQIVPTLNRFAGSSDSESTLRLSEAEIEFKKRLARSYPSQNIWGNVVLYRVWQWLRSDSEPLGSVERMRIHTTLDFRTPSLPSPLAQRVERTGRWRRWLEALDRYEAAFGAASEAPPFPNRTAPRP